jgi:ATP-dependent helicase HrpA
LKFIAHNGRSRDTVLAWEDRLRSRDLYIGDRALGKVYDAVLPPQVLDRASLKLWCKDKAQAKRLEVGPEDLASRDLDGLPAVRYPRTLEIAGQSLSLDYRYAPGEADDGITLKVPVVLLASVPRDAVDWLVPGYLDQKVLALLRTLPKELRRPLVPMPDTSAALLPLLERRFGQQNLIAALCELLLQHFGVAVPAEAFNPDVLERYLSMRIDVIDEAGVSIAASRDLHALQIELAKDKSPLARQAAFTDPAWTRRGLSGWDAEALPDLVRVQRYGGALELYPALVEEGTNVDLRLLPPGPAARRSHRHGVRRLLLKRMPQQAARIGVDVLGDRELLLNFHGLGGSRDLIDDLLIAAADECFLPGEDIRDAEAFADCLAAGRSAFLPVAEALLDQCKRLLAQQRSVRSRLAVFGARLDAAVREDIETQLGELIGGRFLSVTPPEWRAELLRYLRAVELRLDAWPQRVAKDAQYQSMAQAAWRPYDEWRAARPAAWPEPPAMTHYRWLVEEFRVSLFAQRLGTRVPVSKKRLEAAWTAAVNDSSGL